MVTTEQAFIQIATDTEYLKTLPIDKRNSIRAYYAMYKQGKLKLRNVDTLLESNGYCLVSDLIWEKKTNSYEQTKISKRKREIR
jgi:hypothetical protein